MAHPKSALFSAENIPAVAYVNLLNKELGSDWIYWEPETLTKIFDEKFKPAQLKSGAAHQPYDRAITAIFAAKTLLANPDVFASTLEGFEKIIIGLNNHVPDFSSFEVATPAEINYGLQLAKSILGELPKLSDDVISYIRACFAHYGVLAYPSFLLGYEPDSQKELRNKIREAAKLVIPEVPISDDIMTVQAAKLFDIENYAKERLIMAKEEMAKAK